MATHPSRCNCGAESAADAGVAVTVGRGGSRTNFQITARVASPGRMASRKSVRSRPGNASRKSIATSGPSAAPA